VRVPYAPRMDKLRAAVCDEAPDPADAGRRFDRFRLAAELADVPLDELSDDARIVLTLACQKAPYLVALLCRDPERLWRAAERYLRREKPAEVMADELKAHLEHVDEDDHAALAAALRRYRADEMVRLGARELGLGTGAEVGRELSRLAEVCLDAAIGHHHAALARQYGPPRFTDHEGRERDAELTVIGMGKLGGEELNFTSDIDLIFVYSSDAGEAGSLTLHEFFSKLCERVVAALGEVTEDDVVFRVDLRLRPEGSRGAIANSLPSLELYYESWGRPWERQAWLKARPCGGSRALGDEVLSMLSPFIYPRHTSPAIIDDVAELNRRIKAELIVSTVEQGFDVKNGVGGIREIEFFAQALQLIHAGQRPAVRSRTTLVALDQLLFAGIISEAEHRALASAYRFLRRVEHLLQLDSGRQTQRLPADREALTLVARRLDYSGADGFERDLRRYTRDVSALFSTLGVDEAGPPAEVIALLSEDLEPERERELLGALGFRDPNESQAWLDRARKRPGSPFGRGASGAGARAAADLLSEISSCPDPDQAIRYLAELTARSGAWWSIFRLMADNPHILRLVASLFGTSEYLSKAFVSHPELLDALLLAGRASATKTTEELDVALDARLASCDPDDEEARWNALAELKLSEVLRIGLADIAGELEPLEVCRELTVLAEVCLSHAYDLVKGALIERHGVPRDADTGEEARMAILGLGKLGGRELGYASDLDVIFVYSADGESDGPRPLDNVTYMSRVAQRLMSGLHTMHASGRLYEVDTRLRPEGSRGLLVSSVAAWERYHRESSRLWERQALTKLRPVAGDRPLGARVLEDAHRFVYGERAARAMESRPKLAAAITAMRDRIESELAGAIPELDLKAGRGGLIDIEFAAQYLQLAHGHVHREMRATSTVAALSEAAELVIANPDDCQLLIEGYEFLRLIEHRMRFVHDRSVHRLPDDPIELEKLARRAGYPEGADLKDAYARWTRAVRATYDRVLGTSEARGRRPTHPGARAP
jgi:[glutamine synthetase] adenylyltransferase / [glutamine synthetase]-adenylyl-L-tyrosine phosphorylase